MGRNLYPLYFWSIIIGNTFSSDELIAYDLKRREAESAKRPPPELVRAKIPFSACLQAFTEPDNVDDFWSSALQAKSAAVKWVFTTLPHKPLMLSVIF